MAELIKGEDPQVGSGDDYAQLCVPEHARLPWKKILGVTMGVAGAMVFLQLGGLMALMFGSANAIVALLYGTLITGVMTLAFCRWSAQSGLSAIMMSRQSGYGIKGAALASLIYASAFVVLAAVEGSIMSRALHAYIPQVPLWLIMTILGGLMIPLNWYGITQLAKLQRIFLPLHCLLLIAAVAITLTKTSSAGVSWFNFKPAGHEFGGTDLLICIGMMNGLAGLTALLFCDYARFIKKEEYRVATLGIGFLPQIASFFIMGCVGIWFATRFSEANPGVYMVGIMGVLGAAYTVISQARINLINIYSGSLSFADFGTNALNLTRGRGFWVCVTALLALALMLSGLTDHLSTVMTVQGVFMFSWAATLIADFGVTQPMGWTAPRTSYSSWGIKGLVSLLAGSAAGIYCALVTTSSVLSSCSAFIAGGVSFSVYLFIVMTSRGPVGEY